ncbi:MAG TPA: hypothetical protein VN763_10220 [Saprospiraceae bacterium]|nr:hypothetical protein [Saprospiraceae bacterium]
MKFLLLIPFLLVSVISRAQVSQDTTLLRVETIDGNEYIGKIISIDAQNVVLNTDLLGIITLRKSTIKSMTPVYGSQIKEGVLWFENPQSTRYFWQPNGYGLKKGEAYYQNVWIFFNQVSYGVTDNFLIGAGMVPAFLFAGAPTPVWITPKFSIPVVKDKLNVGVGGLMGTVIGESQSGFGLVYGTSTLGDRNTNMSLGVGYGYLSGDWANAPVITLSGMIRTGQRGYLLTENYFISTSEEDLLLLFFGGRRLIKNVGLDFGLMFPLVTGGGFFAIPWLGVTIPFGNTHYTRIKK